MIQIIADCETTGLITNEALPLSQQPRIIEIATVKMEDGEVFDRFSTLVNPGPGFKLPADIPKINGITDEMLIGQPTFSSVFARLAAFFLGAEEFVAHNARFDLMMIVFELRRLDKQWQFPFCPRILDTKSLYSGKLADWGREVKGADYVQKHRAEEDVWLLYDCMKSTVRKQEN